eukprot:g7816.t1
MLRHACLVLGASILVPALRASAGDELLAVVVPTYSGDLDLAVQSITNWPQPTICSTLTKANTDLVLYYAGGQEDAEAVAAVVDTIAKTAGRCFAQTRTVFAELEKKDDVYPKAPSIMFYKMFLDEDVRPHLVEYNAFAIIEWDVLVATDRSFEELYVAAFQVNEEFWVKGSNLEGTSFHSSAEMTGMWQVLGHINGNAIYNNDDPAFVEYVEYTRARWEFDYPYDVALWLTISDFPYSWPLYQRYTNKFVTTNLIAYVGHEEVDHSTVSDAIAGQTLFIHGSSVQGGSRASVDAVRQQKGLAPRRNLRNLREGSRHLQATSMDYTCDETFCTTIDPTATTGLVCDETCETGDPYGTLGCAAGASYGELGYIGDDYGGLCRVCFNDVDTALAADTDDDRAIMCYTAEPVLLYPAGRGPRQRPPVRRILAELTEANESTRTSAQDTRTPENGETEAAFFFAEAAGLPYTHDIARGNMCAFIAGRAVEAEMSEVTVMSILSFNPGMRVAIAAEDAGLAEFERVVGGLPGVTISGTSDLITASLFADEYCGADTSLILYLKAGSMVTRSFTEKDTHSPEGDVLVVYSGVRAGFQGDELARKTELVLGSEVPSFTKGTDLLLPVGANQDLRELVLRSEAESDPQLVEAMHNMTDLNDVFAVPQVMAALAYSRKTPGMWFINPQEWVARNLFKSVSIWEIPLLKPRYTCTIDPALRRSKIPNAVLVAELKNNLDFFAKGGTFYPRTWVLPLEWGAFKTEFDANGKTTRTFIVKPDSGCQGRGIFLTQDLERVDAMESQVAQLYVQRPLLIEGFKFDLRLYVLVTSVIPLRVYAFKDGLTRFCTEEYTRPSGDNLGKRCMHLTNYAVNKGSENFIANDHADRDDLGSKRSLRWLLGWIASERGGQEKADTLWRRMGGAIVKTLVSVMPTLHREYLNTFGADNDLRRPRATSNAYRNDGNSAGGVPNRSGDGGLRADAGAGAGGGSSSVDTGPCGTGVTYRESCNSGTADVLGGNPSHPQRQEDEDVRNAQPACGSDCSSPSEEGQSESAAVPEEKCGPTPRGLGKAAEAGGSMEEYHGPAGEVDDGSIRPDSSRGIGRDGEKEVLGCDTSSSSADGRRSNSGDGTTSSHSRAGGASEIRDPGGGGRERVVEGSRCVEILGFDFMIDAALKPWLIEVNHLPSFATDSPLDRRIKAQVVSTALSVLHAKADDRQSYEDNAKRDSQNRLYQPDNLAAGSAQKEKERKDTEAAVARIRKKLEAIYMRFAPHKLGKVGGLMAKYAGDEEKLLRIVRRKYVKTDRDRAVGEEGKPISTPCCDGRHDGPQTANLRQPNTAPVHGGETEGNVGGQGEGSHEALLKSIANPSEGQMSAWDKPSGGNDKQRGKGEDKSKEGSPKIWPSSARIPDPPQHRRGGIPTTPGERGGKEEGPPTSSFSSCATEHDPEALSREAEILEGWERLHPPLDVAAPVGARKPSPPAGPNIDTNSGQEASQGGDNEVAKGGGEAGDALTYGEGADVREGTVKGGRRRRKPAVAVELMIQRAFEDNRKMTLRLKCPLQQQRGAAMEPQVQSTTKLPHVGGLGHFSAGGVATAAPATASNQQNNRSSGNRSSMPVAVGPEQREKAQRLMEGYSSSSRRSSSAPSGQPSGGATPTLDERSSLPVSLRVAVVRAKEWRRRRDEGNARRNSGSVAVKMHTFDFGGFPEEGGQDKAR